MQLRAGAYRHVSPGPAQLHQRVKVADPNGKLGVNIVLKQKLLHQVRGAAAAVALDQRRVLQQRQVRTLPEKTPGPLPPIIWIAHAHRPLGDH